MRELFRQIRVLIFHIFFVVSVIVISIFGIIIYPISTMKLRMRFTKYFGYWVRFLLRFICDIKTNVIGLENIPKNRAFIVASNHQSAWETFCMQSFFYPLSTVLKVELLFIPIFGQALLTIGPIPINRSSKIKSWNLVLKKGNDKIKNGCNILIFPEGTRVQPNKQKEILKSASQLAAYGKHTILPVIHNSGRNWKKYDKLPGTITMKIFPPIDTNKLTTKELHTKLNNIFIENRKIIDNI